MNKHDITIEERFNLNDDPLLCKLTKLLFDRKYFHAIRQYISSVMSEREGCYMLQIPQEGVERLVSSFEFFEKNSHFNYLRMLKWIEVNKLTILFLSKDNDCDGKLENFPLSTKFVNSNNKFCLAFLKYIDVECNFCSLSNMFALVLPDRQITTPKVFDIQLNLLNTTTDNHYNVTIAKMLTEKWDPMERLITISMDIFQIKSCRHCKKECVKKICTGCRFARYCDERCYHLDWRERGKHWKMCARENKIAEYFSQITLLNYTLGDSVE